MRDDDTRSVFFMSSLLCDWVLVAAENLPHKDRMLEMEAGRQGFFGDLKIFCLDVNP